MSVDQEHIQQAVTEAVQAIGSAGFDRCLAKLVNAHVASDCCLVLSYPLSGAAVYLYDNLADKRELLFSQYLNGIYAYDPFYRALRQGLSEGVYSLPSLLAQASQLGQGAPSPDYMAGFYQATGWQQELGLVLALNEQQWLALFLGRFSATPFSQDEQGRLRHLLPLLNALCQQHWPTGRLSLAQTPPLQVSFPLLQPVAMMQAGSSMHTRIEQALASFGQSRLTRREQQVAALLVQGQDNAAIGQQLGIGEGTVKNHRKQVYAKLAIDSQGALFGHFLNHLITDDLSLKR